MTCTETLVSMSNKAKQIHPRAVWSNQTKSSPIFFGSFGDPEGGLFSGSFGDQRGVTTLLEYLPR